MVLVLLSDNTKDEVSDDFKKLSKLFDTKEITINTNKILFDKLKELITYFLNHPENSAEEFEKNQSEFYKSYFTNPKQMVELVELSNNLKLDELTNIICYYIANIIKNTDTDKLTEIFGKSDLSIEELENMEKYSDIQL